MRHYLYISDVKLDMYYKQIPPPLRDKIAVDLKIDLKIFSATIKEQPLEESRYQKLRLVEQYLRNNGKGGVRQGTRHMGRRDRAHEMGHDLLRQRKARRPCSIRSEASQLHCDEFRRATRM